MTTRNYRYWRSVATGACVFAPASRDLSKHGLWVEITREEFKLWKAQKQY